MLNKIKIILLVIFLLLGLYLGFSYLTYKNFSTDIVFENNKVEEKVKNQDLEEKSNEKESDKEVEEVKEDLPRFKEITITAAGDIMTHMPIIKAHYTEGLGYDFSNPFKYVKDLNAGADLKMANLETVIRDDREPQGFPTFNAPYPIIYGIKSGGFNLLSTANNHSYDQGRQGVLDTIAHIKNAGLDYMGTNAAAEDDRTRLYDFDGLKIGLMCYTYGLNGFTAEEDFLVNIINLDKMAEDIKHLKDQGADKIILFVHWGVEYRIDLYDELQNLGHDILDLGVDYILGSHPHVVMPVERFDNGKFIVYSMGNFLSNQRKEFLPSQNTEEGLFVRFKLEKNLQTKEVDLKDLELIPTWVNRYFTDKWYYEIIPIDQALNGQVQGLEVDENLRNKLLDAKTKADNILNKWWRQVMTGLMKAISQVRVQDIIDILVISFFIYRCLDFLKETRAEQLIKGIGLLLVLTKLSEWLQLFTVNYLLSNILTVGAFAIIVVFQPELRRGLEYLGRSRIFPKNIADAQTSEATKTIEAITSAVASLSRQKIGAIIVIERTVGLRDLIETGTEINGIVSPELLINIFIPNTPLHDGAVIIRKNQILAAACFLPLSENMTISKELGTRHRASLGISEKSDALSIVVSEETGVISITENAQLSRYLDIETLKTILEGIYLPEKNEQSNIMNLWRNINGSKGQDKQE